MKSAVLICALMRLKRLLLSVPAGIQQEPCNPCITGKILSHRRKWEEATSFSDRLCDTSKIDYNNESESELSMITRKSFGKIMARMKYPLILASSAVLVSTLNAYPASVFAQTSRSDCSSKTYEIGERVSRIGAQIINIGSSEGVQVSTYKDPGNPWGGQRDNIFILELGNRATTYNAKQAVAGENLMSSPVLQMTWAREILGAYRKTSKVVYRLTGSDWIINYYLMASGEVKRGQCLPPANRGSAYLPWGFEVCV